MASSENIMKSPTKSIASSDSSINSGSKSPISKFDISSYIGDINIFIGTNINIKFNACKKYYIS